MKKLHLDCDNLRVESFPTAPATVAVGTVHGLAATPGCGQTVAGGSCPKVTCQTYDDTFCGLTRGC